MIPRLGATSRVHGHDVHVRLSDRTHARVQALAEETGLAITGCVRLLIERGLAAGVEPRPGELSVELASELRAVSQSALANLVAAEETLLIISDFLPSHHRKPGQFTEEATSNARRRLLYVERAIAEEAGC